MHALDELPRSCRRSAFDDEPDVSEGVAARVVHAFEPGYDQAAPLCGNLGTSRPVAECIGNDRLLPLEVAAERAE